MARDAINLFQSSYLFTEGLDSLRKATGTVARKVSPERSHRKQVRRAHGIARCTTVRRRLGLDDDARWIHEYISHVYFKLSHGQL